MKIQAMISIGFLINIYIKHIDLWWDDEGFIMPLEISFTSFDGVRMRKLKLTNSPTRIAIPEKSNLIIDPDEWLLYQVREI